MPANLPIWKGTTALVASPESPVWKFGESVTCQQTFEGPYAACLSAASPRGAWGTGDLSAYWVAESIVTHKRGGAGRLTILWEAASGTGGDPGVLLPAGDEGLEPFELNPKLQRHPRYSSVNEENIQQVFAATEGGSQEERDKGYAWLQANGTTLAKELYQKLNRGSEGYYLAGFRYHVTSYSWSLPALSVGGKIEVLAGALASFSCLRIADELQFANGMFRKTQSWLVAPAGHWDTDIYS